MTLPPRGALFPDGALTDHAGLAFKTQDYRQKSNLILIVADAATREQVPQWQKDVQAEHKQWIWLQADVKIVPNPPADFAAGVYAIDRYARFLRYWEHGQWTYEELQREYVYHEARHC